MGLLGETLGLDPKVEPSDRTLRWDTQVGPSSGTIRWGPNVYDKIKVKIKIQRINLNFYFNFYIINICLPQTYFRSRNFREQKLSRFSRILVVFVIVYGSENLKSLYSRKFVLAE